MPEDRDVFTGLTVAENLRLAERDAEPRYDLVYELFPELEQRGAQRAGTLSGGQQQMVAIARALLNDNRMLLVDEPTKGLAPALVAEVARVLERLAELTTVLLVEQNLGVVRRIARNAVVLDQGRVVYTGDAKELLAQHEAREAAAERGAGMSTFLLLTITGLGLGAMYFLIASGLSLIYGLMGVLNFAHGAFITVGSYGTWWASTHLFDGIDSALLALPRERALRSRRWARSSPRSSSSSSSVRSTRGTSSRFSSPSGSSSRSSRSITGIWGPDPKTFVVPPWLHETTDVAGAQIPNDRWIEIAVAAAVLGLLQLFLRRTRYGLIIRAGVENRAMVQALGIDVRKAFTLVFAIGGIAAAIAGVLSGVYFNDVSPEQGTSLLIFAFIVVVIGGLGSIGGSAVAAVVVALVQQYTNYYGSAGMGDLVVVLLLGVVLLARPRGFAGAVVGGRA